MKNSLLLVLLLVIVQFSFQSCQQEEDILILGNDTNASGIANNLPNGANLPIDNAITGVIGALPREVQYPNNNPYSMEKEELGRLLFWDPILSGSQDIACASCHHPNEGYSDGLRVSEGVDGIALTRNSQTIINTAFNGINQNGTYNPTDAPMFWDNRVTGLEAQALQPILSSEEMRGNDIAEEDIVGIVIQRLTNIPDYRDRFEAVFGDAAITEERILRAIATFERGIIGTNSPFDQYMRGNTTALNAEEREGMMLFIEVGCADCHSGPMFSDFELHRIGVPDNNNDNGVNGSFRTPSLRNLTLTGPYMHNGIFNSLEDAVDFYDRGRGGNQNLDPDIRDLQLRGQDVDEIVAFLETLTDTNFDRTIPSEVPSGLPVGGENE